MKVFFEATNHGIGRLHKAANSVLQPIRAHSRKDHKSEGDYRKVSQEGIRLRYRARGMLTRKAGSSRPGKITKELVEARLRYLFLYY